MIYMRIWEGLGNQLFQYAFIRALQLRNHVDVRLCVLPDQGNRTVRQYGLDKFRIKILRDKKFEKMALHIERHKSLKKAVQIILSKTHICTYIEEKNVEYDEKLKLLNKNCYFSGWFQNENYFKDFEEIIRKEIRPKKKIIIPGELRNILNNKNTVSVHIRRGDYKKYNNLLSMKYYEKGIEMIDTQISDAFYIVFSDDLKWVMEHMQFGENVYFVNQDGNLKDYEELFIMSKCKHNIIANSTYSWWGAWLNANKNKIVIGPKKWFADSKLNIMPDTWIKI